MAALGGLRQRQVRLAPTGAEEPLVQYLASRRPVECFVGGSRVIELAV